MGSSLVDGKDIALNIRKAKNKFPFAPREGCVACGHDNKVYVFGGVISTNDLTDAQETNDLLVFDVGTESWQKVDASGTLPPSRATASLVAVGTKLYLFGGLSHNAGWFDDVYVFDTECGSWSALETQGSKPKPRDKLQGVAIGANIYYFGGFGPVSEMGTVIEEEDEEEEAGEEVWEEEEVVEDDPGAEFGWFNDLYVLDTVEKKWTQPLQQNLGVPSPRAAHGMCAISSNIYIFGGRGMMDRLSDLHCFNIETGTWNLELNPKGTLPAPRSFHTTAAVGKHVAIIGGRAQDDSHFGDVHLFDTETGQWIQPSMKGSALTPRGQHVSVLTGNTLVVFGGTGNFSQEHNQCTQFFTDTFLIDAGDFGNMAKPATNGSGE